MSNDDNKGDRAPSKADFAKGTQLHNLSEGQQLVISNQSTRRFVQDGKQIHGGYQAENRGHQSSAQQTTVATPLSQRPAAPKPIINKEK